MLILKAPFSDDFDIRLGTTGTGGHIKTGEGREKHLRLLVLVKHLLTFTDDGSVALYHNNVKKLETAADGVDVDDINLNGKVLTITGDTDDTFKITTGSSGATTLATVDTGGSNGRITLDADGYIQLDANDTAGSTYFFHNGTNYGQIFTGGTSLNFRNNIDDADVRLAGKDGGSFINALILDMSEAGKAIFNAGADL